MIYYLLTWFGTSVTYNREWDQFEHRDIGSRSTELAAVRVELPLAAQMIAAHGRVGCELQYADHAKRTVTVTAAGGFAVHITFGGRFLAALPDGHLSFKDEADDWERFVLVRPETFAALSQLRRSSWVSLPNRALLAPEDIAFQEGCVLRLADRSVRLNGAELRIVTNNHRRTLNISHDGWKVLSYLLYRPIIHYVTFGKDEAFDALDLSMQSVVRFGRYDGEFLLSTDRPNHPIVRTMIPNPVHVQHRRYNRFIDYCSARYQYEPWFVEADYQPVLYLDTDIVVDTPVADLLVDALCSSSITVSEEKFSPLASQGSVGADLLREDRRTVGDAGGFNSGAIAFPSHAMALSTFDAILRAMRRYDDGSSAPRLSHFDQAIANYVGFAMNTVSMAAFQNRMRNFYGNRFDGADHPVGFVHFWGADAPKSGQMRQYMLQLEADLSGS